MSRTSTRFHLTTPRSNSDERRSRTQSRQSQLSPTPSTRRGSSPNPEIRISDQHSTSEIAEESSYGDYSHGMEMSNTQLTNPPERSLRFNLVAPGPEEEHVQTPDLERFSNLPNERREPVKSIYTETRPLKKRLGILDVMALIMNKMIGAGFFTTPGTVLLLTQSKSLSIGLWIVGGAYSAISFSIYLEYGLNFRYNGGDLIYLDEVWPRPELLSTILFSGFFICFGNTAGNSVAFAKHVLAAANSNVDQTTDFDKRMISFIAVSILTVVCLLHYFSASTGLFLNRMLAYYKIGFLFAVFIAGTAARHNTGSGIGDWGSSGHSYFSSLSAMIYILYGYQGWENANYVGGEIKVDKYSLKIGGYLAVGLTTVLYVLATVGYYLACSTADITSKGSDLGMARFLAEQAFGGDTVGFKVCVALSAVGNLIAVVFTSSKVKQCIARQRIIPFWKFFGDDDRQFGTPAGALLLHWICTFVLILAMPNTTDGYSFIIGMFTYGHLIIGLFVGVGLLRLRARMKKFHPDWHFMFLKQRWLRYLTVFLFVGVNGLVLGLGANAPRTRGSIPRYWWPIILLGITVPCSFVYWLVLFSIQKGRFGSKLFGISANVEHPGPIGQNQGMSDHDLMMMEARKDGSNRRTTYTLEGRRWAYISQCTDYLMEKFYKYLW